MPAPKKETANDIIVIDESIITPRAEYCGNYNKAYLRTVVDSYGSWYITGGQKYCVHKLVGVDVEKRRSVCMKTYCINCSDVISRFYSHEEVTWECRGTNQ